MAHVTQTQFDASIAAARFSGRGMELETLPVTVSGANHDEAAERALEIALRQWPKGEHWAQHAACAMRR